MREVINQIKEIIDKFKNFENYTKEQYAQGLMEIKDILYTYGCSS